MPKHPTLTLKRIRKRFKKYPQDKNLHQAIEKGKISKKGFFGLLRKAVRPKGLKS